VQLLVIGCLLVGKTSFSQSIFTSILNTTGETKKLPSSDPRFANYTFEWNVGESSIVTTNSTSNFQVDHGLLQGYLLIQPQVPENGIWYPDEIKIYPNPVVSNFTVELLSVVKGVVVFSFYDSRGNIIFHRSGKYYGNGQTENFTTSQLPAGSYLLRVSVNGFPENGGYLQKQGSFKIIKVK
jgi:Secretion system C-terminal sorting domain